ncbi:hypothetical protein [Gemmobacter serpentinus]|uniref:hypothetical protein n=1 Tax=Gemmobacter serpentinus TaxID=2652247 RepID=UPI00124F5430|nr:hypothetical protein [Gemmobacter serpentinus]
MDALDAAGETDAANAMDAIITKLDDIIDRAGIGTLKGRDLHAELATVQTEASGALDQVSAINGISLEGAISAVGGLVGVLQMAAGAAAQVRASLPGIDTTKLGGLQPELGRFGNPYADIAWPELAPDSSPKPKARPFELGVPDLPKSGRGKKGGGAKDRAEFDEALKQTEKQILLLNAEAAAFVEAAQAGGDYAGAADFARKKAELLMAAQEQGIKVTPELTAKIDKQAQAYATAGLEAEAAADRIADLEAASDRGKDALGSIFDTIISGSGSGSAREAIASLLMEMAKAQFSKGLFGLLDGAGGGGFTSWIGDMLTGARAGGGSVRAGGAYLVNENTPNSEVFVPSRNGGVLNVPQAQAALRDAVRPPQPVMARAAAGGADRVGPGSIGRLDISVAVDESGGLQAFVRNQAGQIVAQSQPVTVRRAVQATGATMERSKVFGGRL